MDYAKTKFKQQMYALKSKGQLIIDRYSKMGFPGCKGAYPDCPEIPDFTIAPCRSCPVLDEIKRKDKNWDK